MIQHEYHLQCQCVEWFRIQYNHIGDLLFAIPNSNDMSGANRKMAMIVMGKLKKSGLVVGMPDLMLAIPRDGFHGLFIELKIHPNKPSEKQLHIHDQLRDQGFRVEVVYTFEAFMDLINEYLGTNKKYP